MDKKQNKYQKPKNTSLTYRIFLWTVILFFLGFCAISGAGVGLLWAFHDDLPSLAPLDDYNSDVWNLPTKVYSSNGKQIATFYEERRELIDIKKLPPELIQAVLAIEDSRFFQHNGLDFQGIFRAAIKNIMAGHIVEGGSTITQQLAKVLFLKPEQTFRRKIKEALLALIIERNYTKKEILDRYFNKIYFGEGAYGVETASKVYFGKSAQNLTTAEAALLAALPKAPSYYSPISNPEHARSRHKIVLDLMAKKNMITEKQANRNFKQFWNQYNQKLHETKDKKRKKIREASYFVEHIRRKLIEKYGANAVYQGGLKVRTTVKLEYQRLLQKKLNKYLVELNKRKENIPDTAEVIPKNPDNPIIEGAVTIKDPQTGEIKAMVGGHAWHVKNQLNRAVQTQRQPGSAFKPILYSAAIDRGFSISSHLQDRPLYFETPQGVWTPQNYNERFHGKVTLRTALINSLNVATVNLMEQIGSETVIKYAKKLGIDSTLTPHMALALGGLNQGVTLEEMIDVYSVFANKGVHTNPIYIREIRDRENNLLERNFTYKREVISPQTAFIISSLLKDVVSVGTGKIVGRHINRPVAGKTGTTNEFRDAWFIGFTPDIVMGSWFGYDKNNRSLGPRMSGGVVAGNFWWKAAKPILKTYPPKTFSLPNGISYAQIDPNTGYLGTPQCPKTTREPFLTGTQPNKKCPVHTHKTRWE